MSMINSVTFGFALATIEEHPLTTITEIGSVRTYTHPAVMITQDQNTGAMTVEADCFGCAKQAVADPMLYTHGDDAASAQFCRMVETDRLQRLIASSRDQ